MADPLSFAASIVAVATLAGTVGTKGYRYLKAAAIRNTEVRQLVASVQILRGVLEPVSPVVWRCRDIPPYTG
jgi:hypothetical protein